MRRQRFMVRSLLWPERRANGAEAPAHGAVGRWPGRLTPLLTRPGHHSEGQ